jgi:hypothetical protein
MSNALAIATVTSALAQIVRKAAQGAVGGAEVVTGPPAGNGAGDALRKVQLYLYQVTPNPALRNVDLPTRSADGKLTQRPQAALDLHYLLSFYGNETDLEPQRMLGAVVRDLHAQPVLSRQEIEDAIASNQLLSGSNLAESVELVKFTAIPLTLEELSKLWSVFFQVHHALSIAYQGSVVLIEGEETPQPVLPVLKRGEDDRGVESLLGPFPALESIHIGLPDDADRRPRLPSYPNAELGMLLTLEGNNMGGDTVIVRFNHPRLATAKEITIPSEDRTEKEIRVTLPSDAAAKTEWAAGIYTLAVIIKRQGIERDRTTNYLSVPLAPRITKMLPPNPIARDGNGNVTLAITCSPNVLPEQRALLLLGDREVMAEDHPEKTDKLTFVVKNAPAVKDLSVYLRVDGVNSMPIIRTGLPPRFEFDPSQKVTIT